MPKVIPHQMDLDKQVERYLFEPTPLEEIMSYQIDRTQGSPTTLTVKIMVDPERFEKE